MQFIELESDCLRYRRFSESDFPRIDMRREAHFLKAQPGGSALDIRWCDRYQYGILREEWDKRPNKPVDFWQALDRLWAETELVIDRPKGSAHPRYPDFVYPLDYGYLQGTTAMDGGGIDVWRGSASNDRLDAVMCIVDLVKRDSEIKLLVGCTEEEKAIVLDAHNGTEFTKGILIRR